MAKRLLRRFLCLLAALLWVCMMGVASAQDGDLVWITEGTDSPADNQAETAEEPPVEEEPIEEEPAEEEAFSEEPSDEIGALEQQGAVEWTYPVLPQELKSDYVRLANAKSLLESDYIPGDLVKITAKKTSSSAIQMREAASVALQKMFDDALSEGLTLYAHSGYRSYQTQKTMYNNRLEKNGGRDDGYVAKPGASDHQTGLGIDVISKDWIGKSFNSAFAQTQEAQWMAANCARYGFIIRYPEGAEAITEIAYEPWHLRYVGLTAAQYIMGTGITLEAFSEEWPLVLEAFELAGGDINTVVADMTLAPDGTLVFTPKQLDIGMYRTDIRGVDGDYEYSLFAPEEVGEE